MNFIKFYVRVLGKILQGVLNYFFGPSVPLNNSKIKAYLNCPKKFFLDNKAKQIVKDKYMHIKNPYKDDRTNLNYFSAMKKALNTVFYMRKKGEGLSESDIINIFSRQYASSMRYNANEDLLKKGKDRIIQFFRYYEAHSGKPVSINWRITVEVDNIRVKGALDLVDELNGEFRLFVLKPIGRLRDKRILAYYDYAMMIAKMYMQTHYKKKFSKIIVYYFEDGTPIVFDLKNDDDIDLLKRGRANVKKTIKRETKSIRNKKFEPNKGVLCHQCQYFFQCEAWNTVTKEVKTLLTDNSRERLSYSKMSSFLNCPRVFKLNYIDHIPQKPHGFFSIGTSIHETFEEFYKYAGPKVRPSMDYLLKLYKKHWHTEGYESKEQERKSWERGKQMVVNYYRHFIENKDFLPAYAIEEYFEIPIGQKAVMLGFIDRIDRHPDGSFEILDYKTEPHMRKQEEVDLDWQLHIYYWAAKTALGFEPKKLTLLMLDFDKTTTTVPNPKIDEDLFQKIEKTVDEVVDSIRTSTSWSPKYNKYCFNCDFIGNCPLWKMENGKYVKTEDNGDKE